jgi:hypothetical protein
MIGAKIKNLYRIEEIKRRQEKEEGKEREIQNILHRRWVLVKKRNEKGNYTTRKSESKMQT